MQRVRNTASEPLHLFEDPDHRVCIEFAVFQHCLAKPVLLDAIFHDDEPSPSLHGVGSIRNVHALVGEVGCQYREDLLDGRRTAKLNVDIAALEQVFEIERAVDQAVQKSRLVRSDRPVKVLWQGVGGPGYAACAA